MQGRFEKARGKQSSNYHRASYQAWHHGGGSEEIIKLAEKEGLQAIVMTLSFSEFIEDHSFLKGIAKLQIQIVIALGMSLSRLAYLITIHDEPVRDAKELITGKRTALHIKVLDYDIITGRTLGLSRSRSCTIRSLLFQNYINKHYGFSSPNDQTESYCYVEDQVNLRVAESFYDGTVFNRRYDLKKRIEANALVEITLGEIQNRNDLIGYLMDYGPVTSCTEHSITILNEETEERFKLKGGIFSLNGFDAHVWAANKRRSVVGFKNLEETVADNFTIKQIEDSVLKELRLGRVNDRDTLLKDLMKTSTLIYVSRNQIIIKPNHENRQYRLRDGVFSKKGLEKVIQQSRSSNSPQSRKPNRGFPEDLLELHRITPRNGIYQKFDSRDPNSLRQTLEMFYRAGQERLVDRLQNVQKRAIKSLETTFQVRRHPNLVAPDFNDLFSPAPFPQFPESPKGHCGPCSVAPIPFRDRVEGHRKEEKTGSIEFGPPESRRVDSKSATRETRAHVKTDPSGGRSPKTIQPASEMEQISKESLQEGKWPVRSPYSKRMDAISNSQTNQLINEQENDNRTYYSPEDLSSLLGLARLFSTITNSCRRARECFDRIRKRKREAAELVDQIRERAEGFIRSYRERTKAIRRDLKTPQQPNQQARENNQGITHRNMK